MPTFGKYKTNCTNCTLFHFRSVSVQVEVDGVEYYYKKDLPEDINANASAVKVTTHTII